jgi:hypothetical protein
MSARSSVACDNELLFADHVQPNEKGQALAARIVARSV